MPIDCVLVVTKIDVATTTPEAPSSTALVSLDQTTINSRERTDPY